MKVLTFCLLIFSALAVHAQESITTFILLRHAEKDLTQSTNDPDLSEEGKMRANRLAQLFAETEVSAIYSTPYKRTRQTVAVLAANKNLAITDYTANNEDELHRMLADHSGGTIVISGHSNTIPWMANKLIGMEKYRPLEDGDYDNIWVVNVIGIGKSAKLVWLNY
jgi:broad specificity phosphatase PhoE